MTKRKRKKGKTALLIVTAVIVAIAVMMTAANYLSVQNLLKKGSSYSKVEFENQLIPEKDENGNWFFTTDDEFKIMHLTDIHIGGGFMSKRVDEMALNAVAAMVTREKPDLVIATGDIAFPVPYRAGTFNNQSGARAFANLMESLGVYWDVTFGNHDAEAYSYFDRKAMGDFYSDEEYKYCLFRSGPEDVDGFGNHTVEVKNSKGIITQAIILIDSQDYVNSNIIESIKGTYDNIHPNQVEWYESEILRMNAENEKLSEESVPVKSLAFFHIPLVEMDDAWQSLKKTDIRILKISDTPRALSVSLADRSAAATERMTFLKRCLSLSQQRQCSTVTTMSTTPPLNTRELFSATATVLTISLIRALISSAHKEAVL